MAAVGLAPFLSCQTLGKCLEEEASRPQHLLPIGISRLRLQHDLHALVLLVLEGLVAIRRLTQLEPVGHDEARVDTARLDVLEALLRRDDAQSPKGDEQ